MKLKTSHKTQNVWELIIKRVMKLETSENSREHISELHRSQIDASSQNYERGDKELKI